MQDGNFYESFLADHMTSAKPFVLFKHSLLFLITFLTATISGAIYPFGPVQIFSDSATDIYYSFWDYLYLPIYYAWFVVDVTKLVFTDAEVLRAGLSFSVSLLFILLMHEAGHYFACRFYGVKATLPYFIPAPPLIGPAGTFGAFIKIQSRIPSRRATFDIGVAGPIAGFVAIVPVAVLGLLEIKYAPNVQPSSFDLIFSDPLFMRLLAWGVGVDLDGFKMNPFYAAAWLGLLVTALNLMPVGQLDGGHAVYSLFGEKLHFLVGLLCFVTMLILALTGLLLYNSPSGLVFALLLAVMLMVPHPRPADETPLDTKRKLVSLLVFLIFVLSFLPFPIQIIE